MPVPNGHVPLPNNTCRHAPWIVRRQQATAAQQQHHPWPQWDKRRWHRQRRLRLVACVCSVSRLLRSSYACLMTRPWWHTVGIHGCAPATGAVVMMNRAVDVKRFIHARLEGAIAGGNQGQAATCTATASGRCHVSTWTRDLAAKLTVSVQECLRVLQGLKHRQLPWMGAAARLATDQQLAKPLAQNTTNPCFG